MYPSISVSNSHPAQKRNLQSTNSLNEQTELSEIAILPTSINPFTSTYTDAATRSNHHSPFPSPAFRQSIHLSIHSSFFHHAPSFSCPIPFVRPICHPQHDRSSKSPKENQLPFDSAAAAAPPSLLDTYSSTANQPSFSLAFAFVTHHRAATAAAAAAAASRSRSADERPRSFVDSFVTPPVASQSDKDTSARTKGRGNGETVKEKGRKEEIEKGARPIDQSSNQSVAQDDTQTDRQTDRQEKVMRFDTNSESNQVHQTDQ
ncbi:hypothetical protein IWX91DRAFT_368799 [Phyllosticta citricarpa]